MIVKIVNFLLKYLLRTSYQVGKDAVQAKKIEKLESENKQLKAEAKVESGIRDRREGLRKKVKKAKDYFKSVSVLVLLVLGTGCAASVKCPVPSKYLEPVKICESVEDFKPEDGGNCIMDCSKYEEGSNIWGACLRLQVIGYEEYQNQVVDMLNELAK
jgi:hypothetical protein